MTDDFDDDALRAAIGSRSGGSVDTGTARTAVIARARRVRTLRAVAIGGTAVVLLVGGLLVIPNGRDTSGTPADRPDAPTPTTPTTVAPSPPVTTTTATAVTGPPTTAVDNEPTTTVSSGGRVTDDGPSTTVAATSLAPPTSAPATPTTSSAPAVADPPFTRRYDSEGGSITVDWNGSALSLVSVVASAGYQSEIEDQSATRIRVRFRGEADVRIEVRVQDGRVEHTVS